MAQYCNSPVIVDNWIIQRSRTSGPATSTVIAAIRCFLRRAEFRFGHSVQAVQAGPIDIDVLTDHVVGDTGVAQPQCQRIR
jgi:hypothetical protein